MKKLLLMVFSVAIMAFAYGVNVNAASYDDAAAAKVENDGKTEIKAADLPQAVKDVLAGDEFKGWKAEENASLIKNESGNEFYEITLKNEAGETKTVKLDKDGKKVE